MRVSCARSRKENVITAILDRTKTTRSRTQRTFLARVSVLQQVPGIFKILTAHTTDCRHLEEKQRTGNPTALYCFYPKPCEKANNGCGRCGLLREQQLVDRPRSIWKDVRRRFRTRDQKWWERHTKPTYRRQDSDLWRDPVTATM